MEPVNSVFPGEGRWLTGDASARASQARLDELLRRLESQESWSALMQTSESCLTLTMTLPLMMKNTRSTPWLP